MVFKFFYHNYHSVNLLNALFVDDFLITNFNNCKTLSCEVLVSVKINTFVFYGPIFMQTYHN